MSVRNPEYRLKKIRRGPSHPLGRRVATPTGWRERNVGTQPVNQSLSRLQVKSIRRSLGALLTTVKADEVGCDNVCSPSGQ